MNRRKEFDNEKDEEEMSKHYHQRLQKDEKSRRQSYHGSRKESANQDGDNSASKINGPPGIQLDRRHNQEKRISRRSSRESSSSVSGSASSDGDRNNSVPSKLKSFIGRRPNEQNYPNSKDEENRRKRRHNSSSDSSSSESSGDVRKRNARKPVESQDILTDKHNRGERKDAKGDEAAIRRNRSKNEYPKRRTNERDMKTPKRRHDTSSSDSDSSD